MSRGPDHEYHIHRNLGMVLGAVAIVGIAGVAWCNNRPQEQPQFTDKPPISGPAIPGASAERETQAIPIELQLLMREAGAVEKSFGGQNITEWRNSLSRDTIVYATFYPEGIFGVVDSNRGVRERSIPTTNSAWFGGIAWGDQVGSEQYPARFKIDIEHPDGSFEVWLGIESYLYNANNPRNYRSMSFVAARTEQDGRIVRITKESSNPVTVDWPRPQ